MSDPTEDLDFLVAGAPIKVDGERWNVVHGLGGGFNLAVRSLPFGTPYTEPVPVFLVRADPVPEQKPKPKPVPARTQYSAEVCSVCGRRFTEPGEVGCAYMHWDSTP